MQERLAFLNHHPQSHLALLDLTLFGESRQSRPYPPSGYLTNGLANLEKSKSQFAHSWFKCASAYPSQGLLGLSPSISRFDFSKIVRVSYDTRPLKQTREIKWDPYWEAKHTYFFSRRQCVRETTLNPWPIDSKYHFRKGESMPLRLLSDLQHRVLNYTKPYPEALFSIIIS